MPRRFYKLSRVGARRDVPKRACWIPESNCVREAASTGSVEKGEKEPKGGCETMELNLRYKEVDVATGGS
jgi:hypothetical protein